MPKAMHVSLAIIFLMIFPLLCTNMMMDTSSESNFENGHQAIIEDGQRLSLSTVDLENDEWKMNHFPNGDFEEWGNPHSPSFISTYTSREFFGWYASTPWPVNEGAQSLGLQARAVDPNHQAQIRLSPTSQLTWYDPTNLTIDFDWWIDENKNPSTSDYFRLEIKLGSNLIMRYFLTGTSLGSNSSNYAYFIFDEPQKQWNTFSRNITQDCFDVTGVYPTTFTTFYFYLNTASSSYNRAFLDDFVLANTTVRIGPAENGDFEDTATWTWGGSRDPGDISQSSISHEGDWSLNATTVSLGNRSTAKFSSDLYTRLTSLNKDRFEFYWNIDDWQEPNEDSYAYLNINMVNETHEFHIYYWLCYVGDESPYNYLGYHNILVDGFNSTGGWNLFNRSIWEDLTALNVTSELWVDRLEFEMECDGYGSRLTVLFDDVYFEAATLNDMSYEVQGDVGTNIRAWGDGYIEESSNFVVTDQSYTGNKAANLTLIDGDSDYFSQDLKYRPLNNYTETDLDFTWYLDDFTGLEYDEISFRLSVGDEHTISYYLATGKSTPYTNTSNQGQFLLPQANQTGVWFNTVRDIYSDYIAVFGATPDTAMYEISFQGETDSGGRLELILDDVYLYNGPAPTVSDITQTPAIPEGYEQIEIAAIVTDDHLDSVFLNYRVNGGTWQMLPMVESTSSNYTATIPGQVWDSEVEFSIFANDTFMQSFTAMDGENYYSFTVVDSIAPIVGITSLSNESTISGVVDIDVTADGTGSEIVVVEFYINDSLVSTDTSTSYTYAWNTSSIPDGQYEVLVRAIDQGGNAAEERLVVIVDNSEALPTDMTPLLLAAAGVLVAVVVLVYFIVIRPKQRSNA